MVTSDKIAEITEGLLGSGELFLVSLTLGAGGAIEVIVDSDTRMTIDQCATLSRSITASMEEEFGEEIMESYSIVVMSAGIGYPLTHPRQLLKCTGHEVSVLCRSGEKLQGTLLCATPTTITLEYIEMVAVEGKKRREAQATTRTIEITDTKTIIEVLTIK